VAVSNQFEGILYNEYDGVVVTASKSDKWDCKLPVMANAPLNFMFLSIDRNWVCLV